jgi:hypothetical protein
LSTEHQTIKTVWVRCKLGYSKKANFKKFPVTVKLPLCKFTYWRMEVQLHFCNIQVHPPAPNPLVKSPSSSLNRSQYGLGDREKISAPDGYGNTVVQAHHITWLANPAYWSFVVGRMRGR